MADPVVPGNPPAGDPPAPPATPDWFESLPPELKVEKSIQSFKGKDVSEVVKSYVSAQKMQGNAIWLPKPDASPEEKARFYTDLYGKLGRPESPDKYTYTRPQLPDGSPWDQNAEKEFLSEAHKAGLNSEQAQRLANWWGSKISAGMAAQIARGQETERQLRGEWGNDFDRKHYLADEAVHTLGGEPLMKLFEMKGLINDPLLIKTFAAVGEMLAESKIISGDIPGQPTGNEAASKLAVIFADKGHPYHKGDPAAVEEVLQLTRAKLGAAGRKVVATMG